MKRILPLVIMAGALAYLAFNARAVRKERDEAKAAAERLSCSLEAASNEIDALRRALEFAKSKTPPEIAPDAITEPVTVVVVEIDESKTGRVIDLPEDAGKWQLSLILDAHWDTLKDDALRAAQVNAKAMWDREPWLVQLRSETHSRILLTDDPCAAPLFPAVDCTPCLLLQRPNGEVIWKESGGKLSKDPEGLRRALQKASRRHCPDGKCPVTMPLPNQPAPHPPAKEELPSVAKDTAEEKPQPRGVPFIAGALAVGFVFFSTVALGRAGIFGLKAFSAARGAK